MDQGEIAGMVGRGEPGKTDRAIIAFKSSSKHHAGANVFSSLAFRNLFPKLSELSGGLASPNCHAVNSFRKLLCNRLNEEVQIHSPIEPIAPWNRLNESA